MIEVISIQPVERFCINCRWCGTNGSGDASRFRCFAPQNERSKKNPVTGKTQYWFDACTSARSGEYERPGCNEAGHWFEEKPAPQPRTTQTIPPTPRPRSPGQVNVDDLLGELE